MSCRFLTQQTCVYRCQNAVIAVHPSLVDASASIMKGQAVDVFVIHGGNHGEQNSGFVGVLRVLLEQAHGVSVFVDDQSLEVGSQEATAKKLAAAALGGTIVITCYLLRTMK